MNHLRLLLYILLLAPGFAGLTVTAILHHRLRERVLLYVLITILAFTAGLLLFVVVYYIEVIAGLGIDLSVVASLVNVAIVVVMYGCLALAVIRLAPGGIEWPLVFLGVLVLAYYAVFGILETVSRPLASWATGHPNVVQLISVVIASAYLGYCGARIRGNAGTLAHPSVRFLLWSLGWMLMVFSILAVATTAAVWALNLNLAPTSFLNFVLYLAWNATAVIGFVRYLSHPVDLFAEEGLPEAAVKRYGISPREAEVILHLSRGLSNREIAERLNVSFTTVRTHVYNIFKKTGAAGRVELLRILSGG